MLVMHGMPPRTFAIMLAIFLLSLPGLSSAASCIDNATEIVFSEQGTLIVAVIGLTVVAIAITYMIGSALNKPEYTIFAKDEIYHLGFSILLLLTFSGVLVVTCNITEMFFTSTLNSLGTTSCYISGSSVNYVANCYLGMAKQDAKELSERYIDKYINEMMESTYSASIQIPLLDAYTATIGSYRRIVSNQYNMILNSFIIPALMSISMQKIILSFITENAVKWILPAAFVLRFFIPTRQMGNMMIAVVIAVYIIVPFMYAFNGAMYDVVFKDCSKPEIAKAVCDNAFDGNSCATAPSVTCANSNSFWNVARLLPQAFFLPNLTIAMVITFLGAANKALRVIG